MCQYKAMHPNLTHNLAYYVGEMCCSFLCDFVRWIGEDDEYIVFTNFLDEYNEKAL